MTDRERLIKESDMSEHQSQKMSRKHKQTKIRKLRNKTKKGNVRRKGKSGETKIMIRTVRKEGGWRGSVRGEVGGGRALTG